MRLLIAEDEEDLAEALAAFFAKNNFSVDTVPDGAEALDYGISGGYDAIILDVMMPRMNGIEALQKLRQSGVKVPVMMLTAKAETADRITGFDAGADDYLPKPFSPDELLSRVRAMLRRGGAEYKAPVLTFANLSLDSAAAELRCGENRAKLSGKELQIMELFLRSPGTVFSAEKLMERVWGWDAEAEINVVWVNISSLRKKLKALGAHAAIRVNRGLGYFLEEEA